MVTFKIANGQDSEVELFQVHKEFACRHSPVLEKAFNCKFIEGQIQTYTLDDVEPEVFRFIFQWLYMERLTLSVHDEKKAGNPADKNTHSRKCYAQYLLLVKLWVLADRLCIDRLQNVIINHIVRIQGECGRMSSACFSYIYESTAEGSPLRRLAVDQAAWFGDSDSFLSRLQDYPKEMLLEIVSVFAKQLPRVVRNRKTASMIAEDYHVIEDKA